METITAGQYLLVYNAFSFTFAAMAAATIFFWFGRSQVGPAYKTALTITGLVTAIPPIIISGFSRAGRRPIR
jgi:hypothetical protein